jgi:hypothetical protein
MSKFRMVRIIRSHLHVPTLTPYLISADCIGSVSLHPFKPWVLTSAGSRRAAESGEDDSLDTDSENGTDDGSTDSSGENEDEDADEQEDDQVIATSTRRSTALMRVHAFANAI